MSRALAQLTYSASPRWRIVFLPFGGGSVWAYYELARCLAPEAEAFGIELPGRGARLGERAIDELQELVDDLFPTLRGLTTERAILFGHSLGAVLVYHLALRLEDKGVAPAAVVLSGQRPPHLPRRHPPVSDLPREAFLQHIRSLGGSSEELFRNQEFVDAILPALRADTRLVEGWKTDVSPKLGCPLFAYGGAQDGWVDRHELAAWIDVAAGDFVLRTFPGAHFYLNERPERVARSLRGDFETL